MHSGDKPHPLSPQEREVLEYLMQEKLGLEELRAISPTEYKVHTIANKPDSVVRDEQIYEKCVSLISKALKLREITEKQAHELHKTLKPSNVRKVSN